MSDSKKDIISGTSENSITVSPAPPVIIDNQGGVVLPAPYPVSRKSGTFIDILKNNVPDDISDDIANILKYQHPKYSVLEILLYGGMILLFIGIAWYLFPRPIPPTIVTYDDIENPYSIIDGEFREISIHSDELLYSASPKPEECLIFLKPHLPQIKQAVKNSKDSFLACRHLLINLCNCHRQLPYPAASDLARTTVFFSTLELLTFAQKYEPDEFIWSFENIELKSMKYIPGDGSDYSQYTVVKKDQKTYEKITPILRQIADLKQKIGKGKKIPAEHLRELDLIEARLLVRQWHLLGGKNPPDDEGNPGVAEREKAWTIANDYPNDANFISLKFFIVRTLLQQDSKINRYYFEGETYFWKKPLQQSYDDLKKKLDSLKEEKK